MEIYVPIPGNTIPNHSAAYRSLITEGLEPTPWVMHNDQSYALMIDLLWKQGDPFILVEHDVAPWPGAITEMIECPRPCCAFPYWHWTSPTQKEYKHSLGLIQFGARFISNHSMPDDFLLTTWQEVAHRFWYDVVPYHAVHVHSPGVAHVRR